MHQNFIQPLRQEKTLFKRAAIFFAICFFHVILYLSWPARPQPAPMAVVAYMQTFNVPTKIVLPKFEPLHSSTLPSKNVKRKKIDVRDPVPPAAISIHYPKSDEATTVTTTATAPTLVPETIITPLDVESLRKLARNNEKYRNKSALEQINEKNGAGKTLEIRVADAVKRSERKNCKTDYAAMGLLAVIPLAYGAISDEGCK